MRISVPVGNFHTALRLAIEDRGLALTRLSEHLAERGVRLSVSTLSNWQRGVSRPERPEMLHALSTLEDVLGLEAGGLAGLLSGVRVGRRRELGPGTSRLLADRLRAQLDAREQPGVRVLSTTDDVLLGADAPPLAGGLQVADVMPERGGGYGQRWVGDYRMVLRAEASGVSRYVVLFHAHGSDLPRLEAGAGCRVGRVAVDEPAGLIAAELLFPELAHGETYPLSYQVSGVRHSSYHGRWIRSGHRYELTVRFGAGEQAGSAYRVWRCDAHSPHKDVAELRLIGGEVAHLVVPDPSPGFHGIRWE